MPSRTPMDIGVRGRGAVGSTTPPRLEIFQGKCKLLKNPECKMYIQYSEKFLGKLCFWGQGQVAQKSWTVKKCSVHSVYSIGGDLCSLGKLLFSGQIFSAAPAKCLPASLWVWMTLSISLATFCRPNSSCAFDSLQHHLHIRHRRDYDKQKAVVVVWASLIREMHMYANVTDASQRLR